MSARFARRRHRRSRAAKNEYSIYDPVPFGIDENGDPVEVTLIYRNLLAGGEPGSGKSSLLNTIIAHIAKASTAANLRGTWRRTSSFKSTAAAA